MTVVTPPPKLPDPPPAPTIGTPAAVGPLGDDVSGGESQDDQLLRLSSESEGEMLTLAAPGKGKKLGPLIPI